MSNLTFVNQVGAPDGINQAGPGTFIPDTFVRWAQDVLFDRAGLLRRRAPFKNFVYGNFVQPSTNNERAVSLVSTLNPNGERILGLVVTASSGSRILFYDSNYKPVGSSTLAGTLSQDAIFDCKQANNNGMWLSFLESYAPASSANEYYQYYWYGGYGVEYAYGSCTLNINSGVTPKTFTNTISGSFGTNTPVPGMFVYRNVGGTLSNGVITGGTDYYIGTVKTANASTITLDKDILRSGPSSGTRTSGYTTAVDSYNTSQQIKVVNVRPYIHCHGRGLITKVYNSKTVTSGSVGTDGEGHFKSADLTGDISGLKWAIYKADSGEWLGDIETISDNVTLNLDTTYHSSETYSAMQADEYIAYPYTGIPSAVISNADSSSFAGIFNATYAGYQWFGNAGNTEDRHRIVFSAYHSSEAIDLSIDGADSISIPGTSEMRGLASSNSGLVIFMADRTYLLRGNYRSNFSLELLYPEGCLSSMSIVEYGGGVFWTSKLGIMYYDGASVRNLTESNLGVYYTDSVKNFNISSDRVYSFLHKDYLFVNFTNFNSAYKPLRYEPIYAESIDNTEAISDFAAQDWDPDFTSDDFNPANNVPIYWNPINMYATEGADAIGQVFNWTSGTSYPKAVRTNASTTLSGLTGMVSGDVGKYVIGTGIPANTTISSITNSTTVVLSAAATSSGTGTVQVVSSLPSSNMVWNSAANQYIWGPADNTEGITFAIYIPTNAVTVLSNFDQRGAVKIDGVNGLRALMATNVISGSNVQARIIDVDSILNTDVTYDSPLDEELIENVGKATENYIKGPDFYLQTKHYSAGDPILRKWFRQVFLDLYLIDGAVRMDVVDNEDNDRIDVQKKSHKNWEVFEELGYSWDDMSSLILPRKLSPNRSTWLNVENLQISWYLLADAAFERRKKRTSWRYPTFGIRLYQMNDYRPRNNQISQRPHTLMLDSWNIGFKPMRQSRV